MRLSTKVAAAGLSCAVMFGAMASASAAIVCNREGVCWHVRQPYAYQPSYGVVVHPNNWRWGPGQRYTWREHPGRGYWRNGVWIRF